MKGSIHNRTKVFISYSHKDSKYLTELKIHLGYFTRNKRIDSWDDTKITPGSQWREEIKNAISMAKVAVLLISADFLDSEFIAKDELPPLLAAAKREGATILPVVVRPCAFKRTNLSQFQAVNDPSQPLSKMQKYKREEVWTKLTELVEIALNVQNTDNVTSETTQPKREVKAPTPSEPSKGAESLIVFGKGLNVQEDYDQAADVLRGACQLQPDSFEAWFEYAYALGKLQRHNEAVKALEHARTLDPHRTVTSIGPSILPASARISTFSGSGSGTYNHGLGAVPDAIILTGANGSQGIGYDSITSTQVRVIQNSVQAFVGLAIKTS